MSTSVSFRTLIVEGERFERWEDPDRPFGYTARARHLESFVAKGRWELLFNALVIGGVRSAEEAHGGQPRERRALAA